MKNYYHFIALQVLLLVFTSPMVGQNSEGQQVDYNALSVSFLERLKENKDTEDIQELLSNVTLGQLETALDTNTKKLAFWVNIYNAFILEILKEQPELYNDRGTFFKKEQISIAGATVSFAKIEHGIIRKSQWTYGLGRVRKWFPDAFERKLRVNERDYRIHFALNCGAKDCPPVAIYSWEHLDEQFEKATEQYLRRTTTYNKEKNEVAVTALFNWFKGDFGGKSGVKNILRKKGLIPKTKDILISYKNYDWNLELDNFTSL